MTKELSDEGSEESSDNLSDSQSTENSSSDVAQEGRRGRWMRRGTVHRMHNNLYTLYTTFSHLLRDGGQTAASKISVYWITRFTIAGPPALIFIADFKINYSILN